MLDKLLPFVFIFVTVCGCPLFENKKNEKVRTNKEAFVQQVKAVDCDDADRFDEVRKLFRKVGATDAEIAIEKFDEATNIVLTVKGKTDETIVVGGHFDKTTLGCGAIDNWTGVVIVANLYANFKDQKPDKTLKFVAFGKEELGLKGSRAMVEEIPRRDVDKYCAMVNFDSFGFTDIWTLETISDKSLINFAKEIAQKRNQPFAVKNFTGASSDSKSFRQRNIPAITLSSLDDNWRDYLHQDKDQLENINFEKVFRNLEFSYQYVKAIESKPCGHFR